MTLQCFASFQDRLVLTTLELHLLDIQFSESECSTEFTDGCAGISVAQTMGHCCDDVVAATVSDSQHDMFKFPGNWRVVSRPIDSCKL
jgi:hypothetical protein